MDKCTYSILIPSYNRYDMLVMMINQLFNFDEDIIITVYDDASSDYRYKSLDNISDKLRVIHNDENNGKMGFYKTINELINANDNIDSEYTIFINDDMELSAYFFDVAKELMVDNKMVNLLTVLDHPVKNYIDGNFISETELFKSLGKINPVPKSHFTKLYVSSGVWGQMNDRIKDNNYYVLIPDFSLIKHLGHTDSVMHPQLRKSTPWHTNNFYDEHLVEIDGELVFVRPVIEKPKDNIHNKKKSSEDISSGNAEQFTETNSKSKNTSGPIINSPIKTKRDELYNPNSSKSINVIPNESLVAKIRKKNLGFGGR